MDGWIRQILQDEDQDGDGDGDEDGDGDGDGEQLGRSEGINE